MTNNNLMIFEGHDVEVFELNGQVLFNPKHVAEILEIADVRSSTRNFDVKDKNFREINNRGENFLTLEGALKLISSARKGQEAKTKLIKALFP